VRAGRVNGRILVRGLLDVNVPLEDLPADVIANGFNALIDGAGMSDVLSWTAGQCIGRENRPGKLFIKCMSADGLMRAKFRPLAKIAPNLLSFKMTARRRAFKPALNAGPVTVMIETVGLDPVDTIGEVGTCRLRGKKAHVVLCKEKGIFPVP